MFAYPSRGFAPAPPELTTEQCKLAVIIKKLVDINEYKYVCKKLVHACWENWQYALTMQAPFAEPSRDFDLAPPALADQQCDTICDQVATKIHPKYVHENSHKKTNSPSGNVH